MQHAFGLNIPITLEEVVDPGRTALLVYDMQEGIFHQAPGLRPVIPRVVEVLEAARGAGVRTFFCRHTSLPNKLAGVSQLRTAMAWQRLTEVDRVTPHFLPGSPGHGLIPEMAPRADEYVFDKFAMSGFAHTPLDFALRDAGVVSIVLVGVVLEIGIAPTVIHATDLGYLPVVVADASGSVDDDARERALTGFDYTLTSLTTDVTTIARLCRSS